ncbi:glycosyltransferase [Azotobacter salinestris]|uniref:O-linked N-acetylglucosamine transferase family protein n=1 Tax=Azotobacter salinestris TaxID=69964 RepID=UPI0032DE7C42
MSRTSPTSPSKTKAFELTQKQPNNATHWKNYGKILVSARDYSDAHNALKTAWNLNDQDAETALLLSQCCQAQNDSSRQQLWLEQVLAIDSENPEAHYRLATLLDTQSQHEKALQHISAALKHTPSNVEYLQRKALTLTYLHRYDEARAILQPLTLKYPKTFSLVNNFGNILRDLGSLDEAELAYRKSIQIAPKSIANPYCNLITCLHYNPKIAKEDILKEILKWERNYRKNNYPKRAEAKNKSPSKRIRIGIFSDGFRNHPVGRMITPALQNIQAAEMEIFAYSTNRHEDEITAALKNSCSQWRDITTIEGNAFDQLLRDDCIDIVIDLCGHNTGERMTTMLMQPAPVIVKWVGGLINTTGISSFDYLLSDAVETPDGEDIYYTEKLIRLPDDYICYLPPPYMPDCQPLPAMRNGYITLGCFNNPTKINDELLREWAKLMHELPDSRLFLKGFQFSSASRRESVTKTLLAHGIDAERLIIEGPSVHRELLEAYNRVDIALDPWPYSGGLTTCEALLMGVPVVTLPGPTFAGRHSATHLINAGMPELVVNDWDEYRARVLELASDLDSLSTIRHHLREVLLQSPVCDGPRFARNFTIAMRAIWQRYCEGKPPAALTLDQEGQAWFEGDSQPIQLQHPAPEPDTEQNSFSFTFEGKVITVDNGALLVGTTGFSSLQRLGAFAAIAFDPTSKVAANATQLKNHGELHHYPHVTLGDGQEAILYTCLDPSMTATLEPLPAEHQLPNNRQATQVIAKLPIATLRLDDIEGLESIDWLLLDNLNDSLKILENGEKALSNTLLVQARVNFLPTHYHRPELTQISHWLCRHGFGFHRLNNLTHASHLPERDDLPKPQATQLIYADALFVPDAERMAKLKENQRIKLAFLLHTVYGMKDLTHWLLAQVDKEKAEQYLVSEGMLTAPQANPRPQISKTSTAEVPLAKLVFFPDYSHANPYQKLLYSIFPQNISIAPGLPWELPVTLCENRIFHLHWEDIIYRDAKSEKEACSLVDDFLEKIRSTKACGWKILWTIHNEAPHENRFPATDRHIRSKLSSLADMALVHSEAARIIQEKDLPELKGKIHTLPIGSYEGYYVNCTSRTKARAKLEIAEHKNVFLFFGNIRPYKGLADLLKAFSSPEIQKTDSILIIAGLGPAYQYIEKYYTGNLEKLKVVNRHIQDDEVQDYFVSADFCVFSFKKILTSSSVLLSYTFSIPVIIPDFASMTEFTGEERGSVSYQNNNVNSLKKAILKCCEMPFGEKKELKKQASSVLTEYRWQNFSHVAHKIISELNDPKNPLTYEPEKTDSMGENLHHALSLTILVFGKDVQDIKKWVEKHKETWPRKHRLVFAFCQGNKSSLELAIPENMSATISESQDEDLVRRITKSLEKIESDFVLLCAADDELLKVPETINQTSTQSLPDVVGYSGAITFRYSDGNLKAAQTNELDLSASDQSERLANYWTPPFPADNSIFYSIFKTSYLIDAFNRMGSSSYEAWDWVCMSAILNIGRIEKCDLMILREKTPSLHYTKSYIEKNKGKPLKNPLSKASHRLKKILPTAQYQAISPGLTQWLEIKKREVDFLLEKTQHNTALKTTNIDQPNKKPITVGGGKI